MNPIMVRVRKAWEHAAWPTLGIAAAVGALAWGVYAPGIINLDGLWMYHQAVHGEFEDWHPVHVSIALSWCLALGLNLKHITLFIAVGTCIGIAQLAHQVLQLSSGGRLTPRQSRWLGLATLLVLLTPITPLLWYLVYWGSDSIVMLGMLAMASAWLGLRERFPQWNRAAQWGAVVAFTLGVAILSVCRHNAVVLVPVAGIMAFLLGGRGKYARACCVILVALGLRFGLCHAAYAYYPINRVHPEDQVMALDLVGIAVVKPDALADLPHTRANLCREDYAQRYVFGAVEPLYGWGTEPIVRYGYARGGHEALAAEYRLAMQKYPGTLATVKLRGFMQQLFNPYPYWHNVEIDANTMGLHFSRRWKPLRALHRHADSLVERDSALALVSARHWVWFGINIGAVALWSYLGWKGRNARKLTLAVLLLVPLAYYLGHVLAMTTNQFRLMYPATLMVQVIVLPLAVARLWQWVNAQLPAPVEAPRDVLPFARAA